MIKHKEVNLLYTPCPACSAALSSSPLFDFDKIVDKALKKLHDKKLRAGDVDADWVYANVSQVWKGVKEGYEGYESIKPNSTDYNKVVQLWTNVHVFSAFKNHQNIIDLVTMLTDENGVFRAFETFVKLAGPVVDKYNKTWLRAEYELAIQSSRQAKKWVGYYQNRDLFPFLQYVTMNDSRVGEDHRPLHHVTYEIGAPFWDNYYPPNRYGCRCKVNQTGGPKREARGGLPELKPIFKNNVGKTGQIFNAAHPYFDIDDQYQARGKDIFGIRIPKKPEGLE